MTFNCLRIFLLAAAMAGQAGCASRKFAGDSPGSKDDGGSQSPDAGGAASGALPQVDGGGNVQGAILGAGGPREKVRLKLTFTPPGPGFEAAFRMAQSEPVSWVESTVNGLAPSATRVLPVVFKTCGGAVNAVYSVITRDVVFCYELVQVLFKVQSNVVSAANASARTSLSVAAVLLHELGHAAVDLYGISATGNQESSADEFATIVALSYLRPDIAQGLTYVFEALIAMRGSNPTSPGAFFDEHPIDLSRLGDVNCLIYGSDTQKYRAMVPQAVLPGRAPKCAREYPIKKDSWKKLFIASGALPPKQGW